MTRIFKQILLLTLCLAVSSVALAQTRSSSTPSTGDMAVGGNLGFANAFEDELEGIEILMSGNFEYFTSDKISWRGMIGFTEFDVDDSGGGQVEMTFINGNIVYNWHRDWLRPFATGGIGIYDLDGSGRLHDFDGDTEIGFNGGGGIEFYLNTDWSIKAEGLFHAISGGDPDLVFTGTGGFSYTF